MKKRGKKTLKEFMNLLKRDNYDGNLVIEINAHKTCREDMEKFVEFLIKNRQTSN